MPINDQYVPSKSMRDLERHAEKCRVALRCEDKLAPDMLDIFTNILPEIDPSFKYEWLPVNEMDGEGMCTYNPPRIFLREDVHLKLKRWDGRARMTAAHELCHSLLHVSKTPLNRNFSSNVVSLNPIANKSVSAEWQANCWASCFLMPKHIVQQFSNPYDLSEACLTSVQAAEFRMKSLGVIEKKKRRTLPFVREILIKGGKKIPDE